MWLYPVLALAVSWRLVRASVSTDCPLDEDVIAELKEVACNISRLDDCARDYRKIVQGRYSGAWGVIVVGDLETISSDSVEWFIHRVGDEPNRCRLLIRDGLLVEAFRTGYREKDIDNEQRQWIHEQAQTLGVQTENFDVCPHSVLRQMIHEHSLLHARHTQRRRRSHQHLHAAVSRMASVFGAETNHAWNVFATKKAEGKVPSVGLNLPHYVNDGRAGFCIGLTPDGFILNAVIIGFDSQKHEQLSRG